MSGAPFVPGSDTSREAAESIAPVSSAIRVRIYEWIRARGRRGATCDEVEEALGLRHQTASARVRELVRSGALVDSGQRRRTRSGRTARVVVTPLSGSLRRSLVRPSPESPAPRKRRVEDPSRLDPQQRRVLDLLVERGALGATCDEVEVLLDLSHQCASARVREVIRKGLAEDSGERRKTRSGRSARVVIAVDALR